MKVRQRKNGFEIVHKGIAVRANTRRIARIVKLIILEDVYDAHWVATTLNTYGDRVPHLGEKK